MQKVEKSVPIELRVFAKNMKHARETQGMLQRELEERSGLARPYLSNVERQSANVGLDSMAWIAQGLKVPLYWLLDPLFPTTYQFSPNTDWLQYEALIDNANDIPYERKVFAHNFREIRLKQGYLLKEAVELADINKAFLVAVEKADSSISLNNAVKLSRLVMTPLATLLTPTLIKTGNLY